MNLIVYYSKNKDILKIVSKYKDTYDADLYEIETINNVNLLNMITNSDISIKRCNLNLTNYKSIILISPLWFNKIPSPVIRFLEQSAGHIKNITYILYNKNKKDKEKEFDKMDRILNLRREKSYFVSLNKKDIHVRVYQ